MFRVLTGADGWEMCNIGKAGKQVANMNSGHPCSCFARPDV